MKKLITLLCIISSFVAFAQSQPINPNGDSPLDLDNPPISQRPMKLDKVCGEVSGSIDKGFILHSTLSSPIHMPMARCQCVQNEIIQLNKELLQKVVKTNLENRDNQMIDQIEVCLHKVQEVWGGSLSFESISLQ